MINMGNLPPIDPGDDVRVYTHQREHLTDGIVIKADDGGMLLGDEYPLWVPWDVVGWLDLRKCGRAQKLLNDYRRDHPKETT